MPVSKDPKDVSEKDSPKSKNPAKKSPKKLKQQYEQKIFLDWCKACGLCIAFCPKKVYEKGKDMKPVVVNPEACNGCLFCELHCPDFAISIEEKMKYRRRKDDV